MKKVREEVLPGACCFHRGSTLQPGDRIPLPEKCSWLVIIMMLMMLMMMIIIRITLMIVTMVVVVMVMVVLVTGVQGRWRGSLA